MKWLDPFLAWQDDNKLVRRDLHAHLELVFQGKRTSGRIARTSLHDLRPLDVLTISKRQAA